MRKLINILAIFTVLLLIGHSMTAIAEGTEEELFEAMELAVACEPIEEQTPEQESVDAPLPTDVSGGTGDAEEPQDQADSHMDAEVQVTDDDISLPEETEVIDEIEEVEAFEEAEQIEEIQEESIAPEDEEPAEVQEESPPTIDTSKLNIEIYSTLDETVSDGETIYLTSKLTGFENIKYALQWQVNDGSGWRDVKGATSSSHSFKANASSIQSQWRLSVNISQ